MVPFDHIGYRQQLDIQEDVKYIKADFLIHQIELAFNQWQTRPWNEGVDFENFKEYLLPYRVENEPLDYWRDSISPLQKNLETYSTYYDNFRHSISQIENRFRTFLFMLDKKIPEPDLKNFKSDCIPTSKANLFVLRILGVPSAIDFIPHFANRNGRHYWATAIDPRINSTQVYQVGIYKAPKIYRRTYSHNPTAKPGKREYVPYFFLDPFNKDVTDLKLAAHCLQQTRRTGDCLSQNGKRYCLPAGSLYRQKRNGPFCSSSHIILRRNCASDYCQQRLFTVYEARQEIS